MMFQSTYKQWSSTENNENMRAILNDFQEKDCCLETSFS